MLVSICIGVGKRLKLHISLIFRYNDATVLETQHS